MEEAVNYYIHRINTEKRTGYMFGVIPFPEGSPLLFTFVNVIVFALMGNYFGIEIIAFPVLFVISWEHYLLSYQRNILFDDCMATEAFMQKELKTNGIDPNFPLDPLYVTKSDREDIFDECTDLIDKGGFLKQLKSHHVFVILLAASYVVSCIVLNYLIN